MKFTPFPQLTTDRLILRQISKNDAEEIFILRSDEQILKYIAQSKAKTMDDAHQFIKMINDGIKANKWLFWGITLKDEPHIIGTICIWNIEEENFRAEVGYSLLASNQGKGYMLESIEKIIDFAFNNIKLHSLAGYVQPENLASIMVLEKCQFKKEAHLKENVYFEGRFIDTAIYSLIDPNAKRD